MNNTFKAYQVKENNDGSFSSEIKQVPFSVLPDNEVLIKVYYSSLNYKDGLSASGNKGVTKSYPFIPGIDASGEVVEDKTGSFKEGDKVIVTGYDLGMNTSGGFGEYIKVPADWIVPLPENLSLLQSMIIGTAGYTAAYGVTRLKRELIDPESGSVVVTGATGGVGSMAVYLLAKLGYSVIAATGKMDQKPLLELLGAEKVIHRDDLYPEKKTLLNSGIYSAAIDTVGGKMLEALIPQMEQDGAIACCGNILGHELNTNIYPFILRGVSLLGIDSGITKMPFRLKIWEMLNGAAGDFPEEAYSVVSLVELDDEIEKILSGKQIGRTVLKHEV
ncbi:MAG: YhdH/YhfP family quinone oxidoreductase [Balneola sp.]|nr:YhdH/YhfP family quinone oxidoreductase [Balneola sp.]MBO6650595.1 YhdH/YhfP family quinone oxidoreductase [Balneola sp.]MBO6712626.1 YhdH/YhfP family quinone oxidoreductase [Balneola sp.]MBO6800880.1 YhdH/YhfP family quinone oxidoreductase [Balneola sp.]MBO6870553.1 YhdH/YhfP family quinone oxidoreductase [Balneola sp.]